MFWFSSASATEKVGEFGDNVSLREKIFSVGLVGSVVGPRVGGLGRTVSPWEKTPLGGWVSGKEGFWDGRLVGWRVGPSVGWLEGAVVGPSLGWRVGSEVSTAVGSPDGFDVGRKEGSSEGSELSEGTKDGVVEGLSV